MRDITWPGCHAPEHAKQLSDAVRAAAQESVDAFKDFKADDAGASGGGGGGGQEPSGDDAKEPEPEQPKQKSSTESKPAAAPEAQSSQPSGLQPSVETAAHATAPSSCTMRTGPTYRAQTESEHHGRA